MICKNNNCKAELPDDAVFCLKCGTQQDIPEPVENDTVIPNDTAVETKDHTNRVKTANKITSFLIAIIIIAGLILILAIAIEFAPRVLPSSDVTTPTVTTKKDLVYALNMSPVKVSEICTSVPNSAGGVDLILYWDDTTNSEIKYIYFYATPYNRVGDVEASDIGGKTTAVCRLVGPYNSGDGGRAVFENVWYNNAISYAEIDKIEIEFMNGKYITFE